MNDSAGTNLVSTVLTGATLRAGHWGSLCLPHAALLPNGAVRFHAYLDGGTAATPSNVMTAVLRSKDGSVLEQWDGAALSHLPSSAISNEFAYNRFASGPFGLRATH